MSTTGSAPSTRSAPTPERILRRLDWQVIRRLDGLLQGDYRTLFYGDGLDFADLREYQLQDDIRHVDWNVTARMNSLYVRQYVEDREITSWFLLDLSPSMGFGPIERPKEMVLIDLVTTLARLLTRNGNRVGAILYNNRIDRTIPPRGGRCQVLRLTRELLKEAEAPRQTTTEVYNRPKACPMRDMTFIWPWMLISLLLIPLLVGGYVLLLRKRQQAATDLGSMSLVQDGSGRKLGRQRHVSPCSS